MPEEINESAGIPLKAFFEQTPPDAQVGINNFGYGSTTSILQVPDVLLFCDHEECEGPRLFHSKDSLYPNDGWVFAILKFACRNCGMRLYRFAICYVVAQRPTGGANGSGFAMKLGQVPTFGPQTPARLLRLVQPDQQLFLQGRRAEIKGLGIGAFAYYRRVVENQRNRIIEKIAKAVKVLGSKQEVDLLFTEALNQYQFSKSIEMIKDYIPEALLINGENPLVLLHNALSKGLHDPAMTDAHCLELAQSIRVVMTELSERIASVTKDDKEIQDALKVLKSIPRSSKQVIASASPMEQAVEPNRLLTEETEPDDNTPQPSSISTAEPQN
jgi:hypothetical protein